MRWLMILVLGSLVGCIAQQDNGTAEPAHNDERVNAPVVTEPTVRDKEVYVFRAKYYRTKGPCVQIGNKLAMPMIDAFSVVEVIQGNFHTKSIHVRHGTGGPDYPESLVEDKVYVLRLTPSPRTKQQLRENETEGYSTLAVDGDELTEEKGEK